MSGSAVTVRLLGGLGGPDATTDRRVDLPTRARVRDLVRSLDLPRHGWTCLVDGRRASRWTRLHGGEAVTLFRPVAGG